MWESGRLFSALLNIFHFNIVFLQFQVNNLPEQGIKDRNNRNKDQHSDNSHQASADTDCCQYPDRRQAHGISYYMRIDQVSFNLLQYKEENNKPECLNRIDHKDQKCYDCASDKCSENRNQCRKGNQDTDQPCVRHLENTHCNDKHGSKNHCFHTLSSQEVGKSAVCQRADLNDSFCLSFLNECKQHFLSLNRKLLLL